MPEATAFFYSLFEKCGLTGTNPDHFLFADDPLWI